MRLRSRSAFLVLPILAGMGLGLAVVAGPAAAQQDNLSQQFDDIRDAVGLGKPRAPLDFTERPPLVVPPSYTLPTPGSGVEANLPVNDPDIASRRKALADPRRPVPPSDPGANASGLAERRYLVDPPSGFRDPSRIAADITTDRSAAGSGEPATGKHRRSHKKRKATSAAQ